MAGVGNMQTREWKLPKAWAAFGCLLGVALAAGQSAAAPKLDYNRDVRPILSDKCFACHGPDAAERQAGLRLDDRTAALQQSESGRLAVVPGKPQESELVRRIATADASERMPPADSKKSLSAEEIATLKQWIEQGAEYDQHWSFRPPVRSATPQTHRTDWARGPVDQFILARLESEGLSPSAEADKAALIRRLTLDLTGLPPTLDEIEAFLADTRPDAYERLMDRLLASPNFGERLALDWLDAARFADTHGYHIDSGRDMTRWREYVIDAFNRDLPYDQFTVEQLAGDLLPEAATPDETLRQKIASGFNRNHMINFEGGAIAQEYLNAYIVDRVNTTSTVFLGLTIACAQCHDHKYDPVSQKEFYQLYAFFNNVPENGLDGSKGNAAPVLQVPDPARQRELDAIAVAMTRLEERIKQPGEDVSRAAEEWAKSAVADSAGLWRTIRPAEMKSSGGAQFKLQDDDAIEVGGPNAAKETYTLSFDAGLKQLTALRLEVLTDDRLTNKGPGRSVNGNIVMTDVRLQRVVDGKREPIKLAAATADFSQDNFPITNAIDDNRTSGWAIFPEVGKPHTAVFTLAERLPLAEAATVTLELDFQSQFGQHQPGRFRIAVTDAERPEAAAALPARIAQILELKPENRTDADRAELAAYHREHLSPAVAAWREELKSLQARKAQLEKNLPTVMVMAERPSLRETFVLMRGAYDKPGEKVAADVPAALGSLPADQPRNRLTLARWLTDPQHPLMARVTVNRYWQMFFGTGIVKTAEDFGSQGEAPTHPELLDWLAVDFVGADEPQRDGWDVKRLVRQLTGSAAYRQSAVVTRELADRDPENRLLARGPRFRLPAEFIRDQALFHSGLLDRRIGGRSVSPYQPPGIWEELASRADGDNWTAQKYSQDHGVDLYRRTMYTFWKRTAPPPSLVTLDAPDRETCTVRRARTNTPLQALVLMNDPTYVEAARKFAERIVREGGSTRDERLAFAFRSVLARSPSAEELRVLQTLYDAQWKKFKADPAAAQKLLTVGESPADRQLDASELATWTVIANALLNTDEAVTKG